MPFQPGKSGNPSGRPKEPQEVKMLARARTPEAIATLAEIMGNEQASHRDRIQAAEALLDRAWGKSTQSVEHSGVVTVDTFTDNEARRMAEALIESASRSDSVRAE